MASETTELASGIYEQGNTLTVQWMPGHEEVTDSEIADTFARKAASEKSPDIESRKAMERVSASFLKRRAAEKATRQWREHILELNQGKRTFNLPKPSPNQKIGISLQTAANKVSRYFQLLSGHAMVAPFLKDKGRWTDSDRCWRCNWGKTKLETRPQRVQRIDGRDPHLVGKSRKHLGGDKWMQGRWGENP